MTGNEIAACAFDRFLEWERKWSDDLEGIDTWGRAGVYAYMMEGIDIDLAKAMVRRDTRS
jgi:hypothetical protein